jgi:MFS family permease
VLRSVYIPTLLLAFANGLLVPVLPLFAASLTESYALVGLALAAEALGTLLADLPAGRWLGRLGHRRTMMLGIAAVALSVALLALVGAVLPLLLARLAAGMGGALWNVSRHAYIAGATARERRGRAIALFGGTVRIGAFLGPLLGGLLAGAYGLRAPFLLYAVLALLALWFAWRFVEGAGAPAARRDLPSVWQLVMAQRSVLLNAGLGQLLAQAVRGGRRVLIPLYGATVLGLSVEAIGVIVSVAALFDVLLVLPAGVVMDRWGRKFAIVPSFMAQALGMALVPLTGGFTGLMLAASLVGLGNGLGSGTMMTLGADLAPEGSVGEFLGVWRLIGDGGSSGGPLLVGAVAEGLGLGPAALAVAAVGALAAFTFARRVPETLRRA